MIFGAVVIKVTKRYRLKMVQTYATTTSYGDEAVHSLYEDVKLSMTNATTQLTIVMGGSNVKVGKMQMAERYRQSQE